MKVRIRLSSSCRRRGQLLARQCLFRRPVDGEGRSAGEEDGGATTDTPATYVVATVGADCQALAIYGGVSSSGEGLRIAVLTRDCEVNARLINWGSMSPAEQVIGATTLETKGIIARI
jgi:hypothetical protein